MKTKVILSVIVLVLVSAYMIAQDVPLNLQAKLMLKVLSMDRNFSRYGDPIKIGISSDKFLNELEACRGTLEVKGKEFVPEKMASLDDIAKYKVIYIGEEWAKSYTAASEKAVENKCLMFCETESGVMSGGGAISFKVAEEKPKIVVNLKNSRNQGTEFPAIFLKSTVVVGGLE
ncbi:MAG: YfiR family protein [Candidatus Aminicenantes bacterium]|nr:MAG: YfiR family protein [Candidatus Aminicenantes bacterium]